MQADGQVHHHSDHHQDITKVDFRCPDNQHDNTRIAIGWTTRHNDHETVNKFFSNVRQFYCTVVATMIQKFPFKNQVLQAIGYLNPNTKDKVSAEDVASLSDRFLSVCPQQKAQLEDEVQDHILTPLSDLPKYDPETSTLNPFWHAVSQMKLPSGSLQFQQLYQLSKVLLTLPHSNADTEHVFSMLKKIQTDSRDNLSDQTMHSLLSVTIQQCHQYKNDVVKAAKKACTSYLNQCASAK